MYAVQTTSGSMVPLPNELTMELSTTEEPNSSEATR
jgi:hypothetical protein